MIAKSGQKDLLLAIIRIYIILPSLFLDKAGELREELVFAMDIC